MVKVTAHMFYLASGNLWAHIFFHLQLGDYWFLNLVSVKWGWYRWNDHYEGKPLSTWGYLRGKWQLVNALAIRQRVGLSSWKSRFPEKQRSTAHALVSITTLKEAGSSSPLQAWNAQAFPRIPLVSVFTHPMATEPTDKLKSPFLFALVSYLSLVCLPLTFCKYAWIVGLGICICAGFHLYPMFLLNETINFP